MKPSEFKEILPALIEEHIPVIVKGPPGIGKSQCVAQVCDDMGIECRDWMRVSQMDSVDVRGLPKLNGGDVMAWQSPDWWPTDPESKGVLFFDEIGQGAESVQAALMQVVLEYRLGNKLLPPGWSIIAATNRESDRAGVHRMPSALSRRFTEINLEPDVADWCKRMILSNAALPEIVAFIRFRPEALHEFDPKLSVDPNPRAWERASRLVAKRFAPEHELQLLQGTVGDGRGLECHAFLKMWRSLPSIDGVLLDPTGSPVPSEPDAFWAVAGALAFRATPNNFDAVLTYVERIGLEVLAGCVMLAKTKTPELQATPAFVRWAVKYQDIFN